MKLLIDGMWYDSNKVAVLVIFDENEQRMLDGMETMVSAPPGTTKEELDKLMDTKIQKSN